MIAWLLKRFLQLIPVLWGVTTLVFFLLKLVPGDPVDILMGENAILADKAAMRAELHLDEPLLKQYLFFWHDLAKGNLGQSFSQKKPIATLILERLPATFELALLSLVLACGIAIPLGILAAIKRHTWIDQLFMLLSQIVHSVPSFWLAPLLVLLFSVQLGWFPVSERGQASSYVLPILTLGLALSAFLLRITRVSFLGILREDYIVTAESKGLSRSTIYLKHALKNAFLPILGVLGLQLGALLSGTVIIETIFDWPGIGELLFHAIQSRDYRLVQACVLAIAVSYVLVNTAIDIAYSWLNPKVRIA